MTSPPTPDASPQPLQTARVVVVGSGFGGLGVAVRLRRAGLTRPGDLLVLERGEDVGGTWRDNTYPGCACDIPSHLYSFSFAQNADWSRRFSPQPEIQAYLRRVARETGVTGHVRFGTAVTGAAWDGTARRWRVSTTTGPVEAEVLVTAAGPLAEPSVPDVPGLAGFEGEVFHSARWRHDLDLTGRRVVVVGTGASAVQFVPEIAPVVDHLTLLQRTPPWVRSRKDRPIPAWRRRMYRALPFAQRVSRLGVYASREAFVGAMLGKEWMQKLGEADATKHLHAQVADPRLRAVLTPDYRLGCKRVLLSDDYYPALTRDNVEVVASALQAVTPDGVVTADGRHHEADTIIFGTGFHVSDMPIGDVVRGADGRLLSEVWQGSPSAYMGTTVPGFPNLFLVMGPNTGLGHNSIVYMIESQVDYVMAALRARGPQAGATIEPTAEAARRFTAEVDRRMQRTVWVQGGCRSWYQDATGRVSTLWPDPTFRFRQRARAFRPQDHRVTPAPHPAGTSPGSGAATSGTTDAGTTTTTAGAAT
jgi:cation diffusion facilitator CzcD-associated flavoprotein CzcO